ncbi:MAG: hypothetical protein H0Z38_04280 [Firmicutes bacterium]|nr:hypothetical protein [Bacillota bacterium]
MWWLFTIALTAWTIWDVNKRKNSNWWILAVLIFGVFALPVYLAKRNLKAGEVREGGTGWNITKNFAILWSIFMLFAFLSGLASLSQEMAYLQNEYDAAGHAVGATVGFGMLFFLWFVVVIVALVIGLFLKKNSIVEKGPTGALALSQMAAANTPADLESEKVDSEDPN